jgi:hypothetical protein
VVPLLATARTQSRHSGSIGMGWLAGGHSVTHTQHLGSTRACARQTHGAEASPNHLVALVGVRATSSSSSSSSRVRGNGPARGRGPHQHQRPPGWTAAAVACGW